MDTTEQTSISHFTVCKILKICSADSFAVSRDGKTIYFAGDNSSAIWRVTVADVALHSVAKPKLSKPELIFVTKDATKTFAETPGVLTHEAARATRIFVDPTTDRLVMASHNGSYRFSTDLKSLEPLTVDQSNLQGAEAQILLDFIQQTSSGRIVAIRQYNVFELTVMDTKISIQFVTHLPEGSFFDSERLGFDIGLDGTMYYAINCKAYQLLPGETEWKHFAGSGNNATISDHERRSGPALAGAFDRDAQVAADRFGNLILSSQFHDALRASAFVRFYRKNGKEQFFLARLRDIRPAKHGRAFSVKHIISLPHSERFYIISELEIIAFDPRVPAPVFVSSLSALWSTQDQLADLQVTLPSGKMLNLHRCIMRVRSPGLLEFLERSTPPKLPFEITDEVFQTLLRFIYDDALPTYSLNEASPVTWVGLRDVAQSFGMDSLAERCKTSFRRALFFADADACLDAVEFVMRKKTKDLVVICFNVLQCRPAVLATEAHARRLAAHSELWVPLLAHYAASILRIEYSSGLFGSLLAKPDVRVEDLPPTLGRDLARLLEPEMAPLADMSINDIPCHRAIMVSKCPFVEAAFSSGLREASERSITLSDPSISKKALECVIRFLYINEATPEILTNDVEICDQILRLVDFLQLEAFGQMIEYCEKVIQIAQELLPKATKPKARSTKKRPSPSPSADENHQDVSTEERKNDTDDDLSAPDSKRRKI